MTEYEKLEAIRALLPERVSTLHDDFKFVALVNNIKEILIDIKLGLTVTKNFSSQSHDPT
jgi:hypothetical protein